MCNVDDSGDRAPMPREEKSAVGAPCVKKCGNPGVLITRIHDSFCKDCFQVYVVHKFRSAIGKSKLIRDGERVLVAYSGGANSSALLHLIQDGLSLRAHKRLRFTPTLLHIDESSLFESRDLWYKEKQDQVRQIMLSSGFPSYWTRLEQSLAVTREDAPASTNGCITDAEQNRLQLTRLDGESNTPGSTTAPGDTEKLQRLIRGVGNTTAQEDFMKNLRNQLLVLAARQLGFSKILTAETSTLLAIRILSDVAQGRGAQVALDTSISDERNSDVMFMRPVRDLNAKELAMYNSLFGVESVFTATLTTKTGLASSIDRLTQTFVCGLQAEFPSTVSNIVRTSEKLGKPGVKGTDKCSFCQSPSDTNVGKASALSAVLFSEKLSRRSQAKPNAQTTNVLCNGTEPASLELTELKSTLCFGCRLSLNTFDGDVWDLPALITNTAALSVRDKQREQLAGFLLEDEDFKS